MQATQEQAWRNFSAIRTHASAMHAILGSYFSYMDLCHFTTFRQELIDEKQPDVFVKEITERYQEQLLSFCLQEEPKS